MILDRSWNRYEQKFTVSYVDEMGKRQMWHRYLHHIKTYEYDDNGKFETWDGKRCNQIFKDAATYQPNEFDQLEFLYELEHTDPQMYKNIYAQRVPKLYTWDIETEVSDEFPYPEKAEQKITSFSLVGPDMSCMVFGLHKLSNESINLFKQRYLDWINNNEFAKDRMSSNKQPIKVLYRYFETEEEMVRAFFVELLPKIGFLAGWNSLGFDWQYVTNRAKNLFGEQEMKSLIKNASPVKEIEYIKYVDVGGNTTKMPAPKHCAIIDYMELCKKYDYVLVPYESYSLDWVSSNAIKANKIKYKGSLQDLYERDHEWYYFYNAIDSLLVMLIHYRLKCIESPCALSSVSLVPLMRAMGQVALTTANVYYEFYQDNKHIVYQRGDFPEQEEFEGAFVGCIPGRYAFTTCSDFASLYPSQIITCNLSFENFYQKKDEYGNVIPWSEEELTEFKSDPKYFVSVNNNVYKNDKDYAFRRMQKRFKQLRAKYKYTGQKVEGELLKKLDARIAELENS